MLRKLGLGLMIVAFGMTAYSQAEDVKENFAFVKAETTDIRKLPTATAPVVQTLNQFDLVVPTEVSKKADWVKIVTLDGKEGWLPIGSVGLINERMPELMAMSKKVDPLVRAVNNTSLPITIKIAGTSHTVPAKKQKVLRFKPGAYNYTLHLPGWTPGSGTKYFDAGGAYTWSFKIVTKTVRRGR